jgi:hypothetical protein
MGAYSVEAGRAMLRVIAGMEPPQFVLCADAHADIRATKAYEKGKLLSLGASPELVMVGLKVTLSSITDGAPSFIDARSLTGPNGQLAWIELSGQQKVVRAPLENRVGLDKLAAPLGADLSAFVAGLGGPCNARLLSESDLDALPYEVGKDERDTIMIGMRRVKEAMPNACRAAADPSSGWEVHFHHADAVFRGNGQLARVRARMHIEGNAPCLGPIEVEQVTAG